MSAKPLPCPECAAAVYPSDADALEAWHVKLTRRFEALERPQDHYRTFPR